MRLHQLTLTAFGPFATTQHVDFDALCGGGLFLLHGATGAGKSSVLDAVCYALYGGVPGARQRRGQAWLRSDLAAPGTATEVVLELTVGGRRLEITRRPEQPRPKRRGSGNTVDRAVTLLREYDPLGARWRSQSRSHQETGEEIGQLLGMSREQFCQVALLPQGDFARFLRSGAEERAQLLGRLFDTRRFVAVERHLTELRGTALARVRGVDEQLLALAHRVGQAAQEADGAGPGAHAQFEACAPGDPGLTDTVLAWAAQAREYSRLRRESTGSAREAASAFHDARLRAAREADTLARLQQEWDRARQRERALSLEAQERKEVSERLRYARAAEAVVPALALRDAQEAAHHRALHRQARTKEALPVELREASVQELQRRERVSRQRLGELRGAFRAEERLGVIGSELRRLDAEIHQDEGALSEAEQWLAHWPAHRSRCQRLVEEAQEAAARAEQLAGQLQPVRRRQEAAAECQALEEGIRAAKVELEEVSEEANEAREHWLDLRERRLRGIAAELAEKLEHGVPCAVCGSLEHPAPARLGAAHVSGEAEEEALEDHRVAEDRRQTVRDKLVELGQRREEAARQAGERTLAELTRQAAELEDALTNARAAAQETNAAKEALGAAEREHAARSEAQREAASRIAARASRREALLVERAGHQQEIERLRGQAPSVAAQARQLEQLADRLLLAGEAAGEVSATAHGLKEADARLADATWRAGFETPTAAAQAALSEKDQRALQHRLDAWQAEERAVAAVLADEGARAAGHRPPADLETAQAQLERAVGRQRTAETAHAAAQARCTAVDRLSTEIKRLASRTAPLREGYDQVAGLAGLAAGTSVDNERKMRLESYVLAARLEQVAAAASQRLGKMSAGRYSLVHSDERASRGARSGLGLHVVDSWSGRERDTSTLSGGETFFASLALALGLADVVSQEAGGARLDTLFIDEGFGSLDEQTLDEVLEVLDSLRERERCVGIVSHVADLRLRIPTQLEVLKRRDGSRLRHHLL